MFLFALPWYGAVQAAGASASVNGWHGLTHLRWLLLLTPSSRLALAGLQATRRAPAVPVTMSVIVSCSAS